MVKTVLLIAIAMQMISLTLMAFRVFRGPTVFDRVVAADAATGILIGLIVTGSMWLRETKYLDYALIVAILGFISTIGYSRYLERGVLFDRDSD